MFWDDSKGYDMKNIWILGVFKGMVKTQSEPWLVQATEGQELGFKSLGWQDESSHVFNGDSPFNYVFGDWVRCLE